jgi:hypothetical protein
MGEVAGAVGNHAGQPAFRCATFIVTFVAAVSTVRFGDWARSSKDIGPVHEKRRVVWRAACCESGDGVGSEAVIYEERHPQPTCEQNRTFVLVCQEVVGRWGRDAKRRGVRVVTTRMCRSGVYVCACGHRAGQAAAPTDGSGPRLGVGLLGLELAVELAQRLMDVPLASPAGRKGH